MAITLVDESLPARVVKGGSATVVVPAGKTIKIETSPQGVDILSVEVPAGKTWTVSFSVHIVET